MSDAILPPLLAFKATRKFAVIDSIDFIYKELHGSKVGVLLDLNCAYSSAIAKDAIGRRPWCQLTDKEHGFSNNGNFIAKYQIADFENIDWDPVMAGEQNASSYLVRKGLSRKAQLALQIKKYNCKHPDSILRTNIPFTAIVETWNAFETMQLNFGGMIANFDSNSTHMPLRQKLEWCLEDVKEIVTSPERKDWYWIMKPSVTNKGLNISIARNFEEILDELEINSDIREWVLQRYIPNPLLVNNHKFHLRVYVLCVGALDVYVFDRILMLLAARPYRLKATEDIHCHLTNTARAVELDDFDEEAFVKLLDDLPGHLQQDYPNLASNAEQAEQVKQKILKDIHDITGELFAAFENEYTVFAPMSNCFELYGLDFLVDSDLNVTLLEVNPGPDFKQTGERLRRVIVELWEQSCALVLDDHAIDKAQLEQLFVNDNDNLHNSNNNNSNNNNNINKNDIPFACHNHRMFQTASWGHNAPKAADFTKVYGKQWSAAGMKGGMGFTK